MKYLVAFIILQLVTAGAANSQQAEVLYKTYCAGCHGARLEGNSAPALVKEKWQHGATYNSIFKIIKAGIPNTEMKGWGSLLKDEQVKALTNYITASQKGLAKTATALPAKLVTSDYILKVEKLDSGNTSTPWAIEFVNANLALISEKPGKLTWMVNGKIDANRITGLPATHTLSATGGFMDIALDKKYNENGWVYLAYSHTNGDIKDKNVAGMTKIIRGKIKDHKWVDQQTLFEVHDSLNVAGEIAGDAGFYLISLGISILPLAIWVKQWHRRILAGLQERSFALIRMDLYLKTIHL